MSNARPAILVTTDGSEHSLRILPHAAAFARAAGTPLLLGRVLQNGDFEREQGESEGAALARARDSRLGELKTALKLAQVDGQAAIVIAGDGEDIPDAVLRLAHEQGAGMIAMDTRGHGALHHMLQGSTALDVLSRTSLPMMLSGAELSDAPEVREPYGIVCTSDGSPASQEVMKALSPLLPSDGIRVTLLRVVEKPPKGEGELQMLQEAERHLRAVSSIFPAADAVDVRVHEIPMMAGIDTTILEEAASLGAQAIAMSAHGTSAARHLVAGSVALQLLSRSHLPVIMARAQE